MKEVLLTSSVLILAVFLVRALFHNAISRRMQYALWGLVLVRLLIPFQFPAMEHNVLTAAAPVQEAISQNIETQTALVPVERMTMEEFQSRSDEILPQVTVVGQRIWFAETEETVMQYRMLTGTEVLTLIWIAGMALMVLWFLISNLRFRSKLLKVRVPYAVEGCKYPVYMVDEGLPSPCLFGFFRPAIYLTPAAVQNETTLRHVLAHETTHARHLDPLWSLLRGVCLVVYWFDPLVWAAAFASRTDCELACDESALKLLGEAERIPYGKTLLSLIPVRKGPASPLLSATTMTSDKKKLTERIKRIAENRQTVHAAIFAVIAIAVMACAVTFTGAKTAEEEAVTLTQEELNWFNTEFFNGESIDIQNQFLSSEYKSPEYINMFELFYCGAAVPAERSAGTTMSQTERKLLLDTYYDGMEPDCACEKIASADMDIVLLENTGLLLSDTRKIGLDDFDYLPKYDAYYFYHGDTNYRSQVVISYGEREGSLVRLYYEDTFMGGGWKCVTLQYREEAGLYQGSFDSTTGSKRVSFVSSAPAYHFVSNLTADPPEAAVRQNLLLHNGNPDKAVKMNDITIAKPQKVEPLDTYSYAGTAGTEKAYSYLDCEDYTIFYWEDADGVIHFSYKKQGEDTVYDVLQCTVMPEGYEYGPFIETYHFMLMGHSGFRVHSYLPDQAQGNLYTRYYEFIDDELYLVAATVLENEILLDADSDGSSELYFDSDYQRLPEGTPNFYFDQGGTIYGVDLHEVVKAAYPEWDFFRFGSIDYENGCIPVTGAYQRVDVFRYMYFTGDEFLFYKDSRETVDHVMGTPDVPADVLEMAKSEVKQLYIDGDFNSPGYDPGYDDWRIENLKLDETYSFTGGNIEVYKMNFEFHASKPENVMLAGGMYLTEEDWVMPSYPNCFYLYFVKENGGRRHIKTAMVNDGSPGIEWFDEEVQRLAEEEGLIALAGN